jgi:hypothetical protein
VNNGKLKIENFAETVSYKAQIPYIYVIQHGFYAALETGRREIMEN